MKKAVRKRNVRGRREVYEHLDAFSKLSYTDRGRWLGEALALVDAVNSGRAGRKVLSAI
jgi:hypothetical protein